MFKQGQEVRISSHRRHRQRYNGQTGLIVNTECTNINADEQVFYSVLVNNELIPFMSDELESLETEREIARAARNQVVSWDLVERKTGWRPEDV